MINQQHCYSQPVLTFYTSYKKALFISGSLPCPGHLPICYLPACWHAWRRWPSLGHWASLPDRLWVPLCPPRSRLAVPKKQCRTPINKLWPTFWLYIRLCYLVHATASLTATGESWTASKPTVDTHRQWGSNGNDYKARQNKVLLSGTGHSEDFWGLMPTQQTSVSPAVPAGLPKVHCCCHWSL